MLANKLLSVGNPRLVTKLDGTTWTGSASSVTATAFGIGVAQTDRVIVMSVAASASAARQVSGVTIGGAAATLAIRSASVAQCTGIYYLAVPSGTTANIVYSFTGTITTLTTHVYALTDWGSVTLYDSNTANGVGITLSTASDLDTVDGGLLLAVAATDSTVPPTFTSSPTLTQDKLYNNGTKCGLCSSMYPSTAAWATNVKLESDISGPSKSICAAAFS